MAKQGDGALGGFRGKMGPTVGYMWNGIWCVRSLPNKVKNPKTEKQLAHRELFKQQVQFASHMHWVISEGLYNASREAKMTGYNLFVKLNQQAFSMEEGTFTVDYSRLQVSAGGLAPVSFGAAHLDASGVLSVDFEKNPLHTRADNYDNVKLCLYCPEVGEGFLSNGDYRRNGSCRIVLPQWMMGHEVHIYGFVRNAKGFCSVSQYIGSLIAEEGHASQTDEENDVKRSIESVDLETGEIIAAPETIDEGQSPKKTTRKKAAKKKPVKRE